MLDFVLWSFAIALTPWALSLAWKLISGVRDLNSFRQSPALQESKRRSPLYSLNLNPLSSSGSMPGRVPRSGTRQISAPPRYGPF
jgi:hypothetical protein